MYEANVHNKSKGLKSLFIEQWPNLLWYPKVIFGDKYSS